MTITRRLADPLLALPFLVSGAEALRDPGPPDGPGPGVATPEATAGRFDDAALRRATGAVQVVAASLLAAGRFPRVAAAILLATVLPVTGAGGRFWDDGVAAAASTRRRLVLSKVGLVGALVMAAAGSEKGPSRRHRRATGSGVTPGHDPRPSAAP